MFIFRQLFDPVSSTYTYLLADSGQAVLIDPVFEHAGRDAALLRELGLTLTATLETHVHADHVTGAWLLRQRCGSRMLLSAHGGATGADGLLTHGDTVPFGNRHLQARATPGHTNGCMTYVLDDASMAFTGDALLIRGCGRTDFQNGDAGALYESITGTLFTLPADTVVYPGHDYRGRSCSTIDEEQRWNPRLAGKAKAEFVAIMSQLALPAPKLLAIAVPANRACGDAPPQAS